MWWKDAPENTFESLTACIALIEPMMIKMEAIMIKIEPIMIKPLLVIIGLIMVIT